MSKKSLLSAFVLLAGTFLSTPSFAQTAEVGCASCVAPIFAPLQMAQMTPQTAQEAPRGTRTEATTRSDDPKGQSVLRTCCDPVLAGIKAFTMFGQDLNVNGTLADNYGFKFLPTTAFSNAMNNTAFMANVMAMAPNSLLVMVGDMRTDNNAALGTSDPWSASLFPGYWTNFNQSVPAANQLLAIWDSNIANVLGTNWAQVNPYLRGLVGPSHMRPDGTRYIMKISYWLYYQTATGWVRSQIICNNLPDQYVGSRHNTAGLRVAAGGSVPAIELLSQSVSTTEGAANMRVGAAIPLTPAEIQAIPTNLR